MKWISAKEKLPDKDGRYLVVEDHCSRWRGVSSFRHGKFDLPVTHWFEIPELPEEGVEIGEFRVPECKF